MLIERLRQFARAPENQSALAQLLQVSLDLESFRVECSQAIESSGDEQAPIPQRPQLDVMNQLPAGLFEVAPKHLARHVVDVYLKRKVANFLGIPFRQVAHNTPIVVSPDYCAQEGKIKGMWEAFKKKGVVDLRIDLQPSRETFSDHYGTIKKKIE